MGDNVDAAKQASQNAAQALPAAAPKPNQRCPPKARPKPDPCANLGLASNANATEYTNEFRQLQADWATLTPEQRRQQIEDITNKQLAKSGVPRVGVRGAATGNPGSGSFDFPTWNMDIDSGTLASNTISDDDATTLANAVYHESRHAEQWYMMAQRRSSQLRQIRGTTPRGRTNTITNELSIPRNVARTADQNPLPLGSPGSDCAAKFYRSVYGRNAAARNRTLTNLETHGRAVERAQQRLDALNNSGTATTAQINRAQARLTRAQNTYYRSYQAYRRLPEEADAYRAGGRVTSSWATTPLPPATPPPPPAPPPTGGSPKP